jgi:hypothetical protein
MEIMARKNEIPATNRIVEIAIFRAISAGIFLLKPCPALDPVRSAASSSKLLATSGLENLTKGDSEG